jgi:hypothetical protein
MWAIKILKQLIESRFYGKVVLSFECGKIVLVKKEETIKPK